MVLKVSGKTIKQDIRKLKNSNNIIRRGGLKTGYWELLGIT